MPSNSSSPRSPIRTLIRRARQKRSLAPSALARRIGWEPDEGARTIRQIENGDYLFPTDVELEELAEPLDLEPERLKAARDGELVRLNSAEFTPFVVLYFASRYPRRRELPSSVSNKSEMLQYARTLRSHYSDEIPISVYVVLSPVRAVRIDEDGDMSLTTHPPMVDRDLPDTFG